MKITNLLFFLIYNICTFSQQNLEFSVHNVAVNNSDNGLIEVTYNIESKKTDALFVVTLDVYKNPDIKLKPISLSGDVGTRISNGDKKILWDAQKDGFVINDKIFAEVRVYPVSHIPERQHLLKSAVFPGWGHYRINNSKLNFITGVAAYGSLASTFYFNSAQKATYQLYRNSNDLAEVVKLHNKSLNQRKLSIAFAGITGIIWAYELYSVHRRIEVLKSRGINPKNSQYYYDRFSAYASARSNISNIDNRSAYLKAIDDGNAALHINDYPNALAFFRKALAEKPDDELARDLLNKTDYLINEYHIIEAQYIELMHKADALYFENKLNEALLIYNEMLILRPDDCKTKKKIDVIKSIIQED